MLLCRLRRPSETDIGLPSLSCAFCGSLGTCCRADQPRTMLEFLRDLKQAYEEGLIEKSEVFHVLLDVDIYA